MNIWKSAIGVLLGTTLVLNLTGQAIAQADDSADTKLELVGGTCTGAIDTAEVNLGTYTFDGIHFVPDGASGSATFSVTVVDTTISGSGCEIEVEASDLESETGTTTLRVDLSAPTVSKANKISLDVGKDSSVVVTASIDPSFGSNVESGAYTGDITVTNPASSG